MSLVVTILAGGDGKRMRSTTPKVLHSYLGTPMLVRIIHECLSLHPTRIYVITGKNHDMIQSVLHTYKIDYVLLRQQKHQLGTADAIKTVIHEYKDNDNVIIEYHKIESFYQQVENGQKSECNNRQFRDVDGNKNPRLFSCASKPLLKTIEKNNF